MRIQNDSRKNILIILALGAALIVTVIISFFLGRFPISPVELISIVFSKIFPIEQFWTDSMETVLFNVRLPRILLGCIVGCSLSSAGAAYQGIFRNPMASPDILGASAGAAFGAALAFLNDLSGTMVICSAFLFSLLCVAIVYLISQKAKGSKILGLVLSGIMVSSLFTAGTSYIKLVADPNDQLPKITYWLMGSLAGTKIKEVLFAAIVTLIGLIPLVLLRWRINVLTFGDDEARTMGVNAKRIRLIVIICSSLVTATCVSVSGMIGWVGLVIPHLTRRLVGNNYRYLLPATMLMGAVFLLAVDNISRNLLSIEIPIGILTAFVGAPFFIYLITREAGQE